MLLAALLTLAPMPLDLMSFNIRYGTAVDGPNAWPLRREQVFNVIRAHRPDVLGIQEALRFQLDEIHSAVPGYAEIGQGRDDGKQEGEYCAIFFRRDKLEAVAAGQFWFSDTPEVPGSKHWGNRVTRIATWAKLHDKTTQKQFVVLNVHLDHESQESRLKSVELLQSKAERIASGVPTIIMGDLNVGEDNPVYLALSKRLTDTFRALHPSAPNAGTFNAFAGTTNGPKIDFIFASAEFNVRDAKILRTHENGKYPSDHFPVTARVHLP